MFSRPIEPRKRIIVPLDVVEESQVLSLVQALQGKVGMFKVGKELYTSLGPRAVELIRAQGGEVFLDLKYHDIPNTVAGAVKAAAGLGVGMLTVHAAGGRAMLQAAVAAAGESPQAIVLLAVTVLTSLGHQDLREIGFLGGPEEMAIRLGRLAVECKVAGLVASAKEVGAIRSAFGPKPLLVTPGIRPPGSSLDDQARVSTPARAVREGADFLVIGRPITRAPDPEVAVERVLKHLTSTM